MLISRFCRNVLKGSKIGVEIELEGVYEEDAYGLENWEVHSEGSLRNGLEVVSKPITLEELPDALEEISHLLSSCTWSDRCSIHVHVNMGDLSTLKVVKNSALYLALERAIIAEYNMRSSNNYCVPLYKATNPLEFAYNMFACRDTINSSYHKYMALNVIPLNRFGTVEYRGMPLLTDTNEIFNWCQLLLEIKHMAVSMDLVKFKEFGIDYLASICEEFPRINSLIVNYTEEVVIGCMHSATEVEKCAA